jgi:hypothetical protein
MSKYRKKPVVIDAVLWSGTEGAYHEILSLAGPDRVCIADGDHLAVETIEGTMRANKGDWIIRGVEGEVYPCKASIFDATYEVADD